MAGGPRDWWIRTWRVECDVKRVRQRKIGTKCSGLQAVGYHVFLYIDRWFRH